MRTVPAKNGWFWLLKGFALFRKNPAMWMFLVFTYWIAVTLLGQVRYVGAAASTVLLPGFTVSFMVMCAVLDRGGALQPALLIAGFRQRLGTLVALGAAYLVAIVATLVVSSVADSGALLKLVVAGENPSTEAIGDGSVSRALLLAALASAPVFMAFWFAPVLAAWDRMSAVQSLFYSFFSVLRNWRAFVVYAAALALAIGGFLLLVTFAAILFRAQLQALRFVALLFMLSMLPTVFGSFYASYRDVFPDKPGPGEASLPPASP